MSKFAFGELGWTPQVFYSCSLYEFFCACEGYFDKMDRESIRFRNLFSVMFYAHGGKGDIESVWQIGKKKEKETRVWGTTPEEALANYNRIMGREFPQNNN